MGYPRAIAHIDADAFFAAVEQALNPAYAGRPVVTGQERNIVAAASYEAKARGVKRGVALWDVKRIIPDCIILPSDYETYSLYSIRLFNILRRYTPVVEEASVDEAYLDLTGVSRLHRAGYRTIAERIQADVLRELGIGVSIGISITRSLAKIASKFRKPRGITAVPAQHVPELLRRVPASAVCGIGPRTTALLEKHGVKTAEEFARLPERFVQRLLGKVGLELWFELNGAPVFPFQLEPKACYMTIMKSKTFAPPSRDPAFLAAQAVRNLESACIKAHRHHLAASRLLLMLKRQDFSYRYAETKLVRRTNMAVALIPEVRALFARLHEPGVEYRSTGVILGDLAVDEAVQYSLFEDPRLHDRQVRLQEAMTDLSGMFGKHVVTTGASLHLPRPQSTSRAKKPDRKNDLLPGETARRRMNIPLWKVGV